MKSGPSCTQSVRMTFGSFGTPPDRRSTVNCSSGSSITSVGPNMMRDDWVL